MINMELPPTFVKGFHDEESVRKMRYNTLGNTGLQVSHLGFGGGGLADFYEKFNEADGINVVHEALKRGVNYIDTAAYYGNDRKSERILGKALKDVPREAYYIGTKVARYSKDVLTGFDFSYDRTLRSVDESLELLGLTYVDIIQAHDIEFAPNLDIVVNETLPALAEVVKAGKARFIGVTGYPIHVLKEAISRSTVAIDCVLCYARSTLIDMTLLEYLPYFQSKGLGIFSAAGISMGLLSNNGPWPWHPAHEDIKIVCATAAELCKNKGVELGRLAAYHTMNVPGPASHLLGMNSIKVLTDNLDVCLNGLNAFEQAIMLEVKQKCFDKLSARHWEGVEVSRYREELAKLKSNK